MSISFAEEWPYTCQKCGNRGVADVWLLIDVVERPDLVERVKAKRLRTASCQTCSATVQLPVSVLLIYLPREKRLMFATDSVPEPHQTMSGADRQLVFPLLLRLSDALGTRDSRMGHEIGIIPMSLVHLAVDEERLARLDALIQDFATADGEHRRQLVVEHSELTGDDMLGLLDLRIMGFRKSLNHESEEKDRDIRKLLERVRDVGVEAALAETSATMSFIAGLEREQLRLGIALRELFEAGVDVDNSAALRNALQENEQWRGKFDEAMAETRATLVDRAARRDIDPQVRKDACVLLIAMMGFEPEFKPDEFIHHLYEAAVVVLGPGPQQVERAAMSVKCLRILLPMLPPDAPIRQEMLVYLAHAHIQHRTPGDLDRADDCLRRAIGVVPATRQAATKILMGRGQLLREKAEIRGDDALHDAIAVFSDILDNGDPDQRTTSNVNHMIACCYSFMNRGDRPTNIRTGIEYARRALDTGADAVSRNSVLMMTVTLELALAELDPGAGIETLCEHLRSGIRDAEHLGFHDSVFYFAHRLGLLEANRDNWTDAATAYASAVAAVNRFYDEIDTEIDRRQLLVEVGVMNSEAAYALARAGRPVEAAQALEQGRARALVRAMRRERVDLTALERVRPDLAGRFRDVAGRLSMLEQHARDDDVNMPLSEPITRGAVSNYASQTAYEYDTMVDGIRALPGFEKFLLPTDYQALVDRLPAHEPVVYLCAAKHGSLALIVDSSEAGAPRAEFGSLTTAVVSDLIAEWAPGQLGDKTALSASLPGVLNELGERLVAPLMRRLRETNAERVVLIPCGRLGLFPVHAALPPTQQVRCGEARLPDEFDISYAPSLETYIAARDRVGERDAWPPVLAGVGDPEPNPRPLPFARIEIAHVADFFRRVLSAECNPLIGPQASLGAVMAASERANYVHLACHGEFLPTAPLKSCLVLAGKDRLTLRDVMSSPDFDDVRMVVLSACQTGMTEVEGLPEEVIGLPSGFLHAGVPGVVGALWSVDDVSTALLMKAFYECLEADPSHSPAAALRGAQRRVAAMTYEEARAFIDSDVTRGSDSRNVCDTSRALDSTCTPEPDRDVTRDRPFADPYYWAAFTLTGC